MTASSRGSRAAVSIIRSSKRRQLICSDCLNRSTRRNYAATATTVNTSSPEPVSSLPHLSKFPPVTASAHTYKVNAGVLLTRAPLLTARQTPFEKAFFFYQKRLNERLVMPFTRYFYFKKDTPADTDWKIKARERNGTPARELGGYRAYGDEAWNDELLAAEAEVAPEEGKLMGKLGLAEPKWVVESLVRDSKVRAVEGKDGSAVEVKEGMEGLLDVKDIRVERPMSRFTEADRKNDFKRLDRALERTLYLLVKRKDSGWGFPQGELIGRENLHQAAERILVQAAGLNMNTWIVGHVPIGHHVLTPRHESREAGSPIVSQGEKTFFMKGRIMAGQADLSANVFGLEDFKWATKQEVKKTVSPKYFSSVADMMADR